MYAYTPINKAWETKFLTSHSDVQTLQVRPSPSYGTRFVIKEFSLHNRTGGAATLGIGGRIQSTLWRWYFWDDSEYAAASAIIDDTVDAQDADTGDVNLDTVSTNNDGFAIGCDLPFNIASLVISQASAAGTVWEVYYSIASVGTGFSNNFKALTNLLVAPSFAATGEQLIWFDPPSDWHKVTSNTAIVNRHGRSDLQAAGYPAVSQYLLVVKSATAPNATRGQMTLATLGHVVMSTVNVQDGSILTNIGGAEIYLPGACDALCAASSVANAQNRVDVKWRYSG